MGRVAAAPIALGPLARKICETWLVCVFWPAEHSGFSFHSCSSIALAVDDYIIMLQSRHRPTPPLPSQPAVPSVHTYWFNAPSTTPTYRPSPTGRITDAADCRWVDGSLQLSVIPEIFWLIFTTIIVIIHEFHRDASLEQNFRAARYVMVMTWSPVVACSRLSQRQRGRHVLEPSAEWPCERHNLNFRFGTVFSWDSGGARSSGCTFSSKKLTTFFQIW